MAAAGGFGHLRQVLREEGVRGAWWRGLGVTVYRRLTLSAQEADSIPRREEPGVDIGFLEPGDIDEYLRLRPDESPAEVERRLASGQYCATVLSEGTLASIRWMSTAFAEFPYLGLRFELAEGVGYIYDVYTDPAFRGRRLQRTTTPSYEAFLAEKGVRTWLGTAWLQNPPGVALVKGSKFEGLGTVGCVRLGPLRVPVKRVPPGYLGRASRLRPAG
jgi:hypothetical protein